MKTAKTAISLPQELLEQTDKVARETGNSRSGVVAIALSKYLQQLKQERMLAQLNEVYDEPLAVEDLEVLKAGKAYLEQNIIDREEW